tara:strand:+ start:4664 stop:5149 length:486 start_codon:yes stop_codon:yes gene_type:complete
MEEIDKKAIQEMVELSEQLPEDVFATVPDEETVDIKISGAFSRSIQKTLEYVINGVDPAEATRALEYVKADYKGEDFDETKVCDLDVAVWTLMMLTNEFNAQAGLQKKTRIYDRKTFMEALTGQGDTAMPLTDEDITARVIAANKKSQEALKKDKKKGKKK